MLKLVSKLTIPVVAWVLALPVMAQVAPEDIDPVVTFEKEDLVDLLVSFANWTLLLIAIIAVIMIIYGAFIYMTTAGDETKVEKGKNIIIYGIVGVLIAILAFGVISFVNSFIF